MPGDSFFVLADGRSLRPERAAEVPHLRSALVGDIGPPVLRELLTALERQAAELAPDTVVDRATLREHFSILADIAQIEAGTTTRRALEHHLEQVHLGRDFRGMVSMWLGAAEVEPTPVDTFLSAADMPQYLAWQPRRGPLSGLDRVVLDRLGGDPANSGYIMWYTRNENAPLMLVSELRAVFRHSSDATAFIQQSIDVARGKPGEGQLAAIPQAPLVGEDCLVFGGNVGVGPQEDRRGVRTFIYTFRVGAVAVRLCVGSGKYCPPDKQITLPKVRMIAERQREIVADPSSRSRPACIDWPLPDPPPDRHSRQAGPGETICSKCRAVQPAHYKFCLGCGAALPR
jgi:hypothetical protein